MKKHLSIKLKNLTTFALISIISILIVGIGGFFSAKNSLQHARIDALTAIRESKKQQIETFFNGKRDECQTFARNLMIVDAMKEFKKAFSTVTQQLQYTPEKLAECTKSLKAYYEKDYLEKLNANIETPQTLEHYFAQMPEVTTILQYLYISHNPNPVGQKDNLDNAEDGSDYSKIHAKYHPVIREYLKKFKYYDIFLFDLQSGSMIYSVYKEIDFATSLYTGPIKNSNLAALLKEIQKAQSIDFIKLVDFKFYDPSYGKPASFIGAPIYDQGKKIGALIMQIPIELINNITMNSQKWEETGLGKTGEAYIIGSDYTMRTDSRLLVQNPDLYFSILEKIGTPKAIINRLQLLKSTILIQEVNTTASRQVVRGNTNTIFDDDYLNQPTISAFTPAKLKDFDWGLIVEMNRSEVLESTYALAWAFTFWGIGTLILIIILCLLFYSYIIHSKS